LLPAQIIAFFYAGFGVRAIFANYNPISLIFVVPGVLLAFASWSPTGKAA
jgi:hypothetical protein